MLVWCFYLRIERNSCGLKFEMFSMKKMRNKILHRNINWLIKIAYSVAKQRIKNRLFFSSRYLKSKKFFNKKIRIQLFFLSTQLCLQLFHCQNNSTKSSDKDIWFIWFAMLAILQYRYTVFKKLYIDFLFQWRA